RIAPRRKYPELLYSNFVPGSKCRSPLSTSQQSPARCSPSGSPDPPETRACSESLGYRTCEKAAPSRLRDSQSRCDSTASNLKCVHRGEPWLRLRLQNEKGGELLRHGSNFKFCLQIVWDLPPQRLARRVCGLVWQPAPPH